jgi:hypothetical protein
MSIEGHLRGLGEWELEVVTTELLLPCQPTANPVHHE